MLPRSFCNVVSRYPNVLGAVVVFLFSVALYAGSLKNGFVWDDEGVFVNAPEIRDLANIPSFFVSPLVLGDSSDEHQDSGRIRYYRPLLSTLHAIEYRWFGTDPLGYKVVNLVLNGLVVVCAFFLVAGISGHVGVALLASLLYAANPTRGEVVYWAYSDSHILAALFSLLTLLAYRSGRTGAAMACMAAALLFQESAVLLPLVLLGYEWLVPKAKSLRGMGYQRLFPFVLLAAAYLGLRQLAVGSLPVTSLDFPVLLRAVAYLLVHHTKIFFVPDAPVTMYLYVPGMFAAGGVAGLGTLLLAGLLLGIGILLLSMRKGWFFWYAWFFVWISISFNVGSYANYLMAEKSLYLAALGPCTLLAAVALSAKRLRAAGVALLLALTAFHAAETVGRSPYWGDTQTYLQKLLEFEPAYDVAQYQLGIEYMKSGQYRLAVEQFEKVQSLRPDLRARMAGLQAEAYGKWGKELAERGDLTGALSALESARQKMPQRSETYNGLGVVHFMLGDVNRAVAAWEEALRLDPANSEARYNLQRLGGRAAETK